MEKLNIRNELDLLVFLKRGLRDHAGVVTLQSLHSFLSGYRTACAIYGNSYELGFPGLNKFSWWIAKKMRNRPAKGWQRLILEEIGVDGPEAVERFYELLDEFLEYSASEKG